jgi:ribosomal protein S18 acetylase RimI-like enzyme
MALVQIRRLGPGDDDAVRRAEALFDGPAREDATRRFLAEPGHHLLVAYDGEVPVGFVSGVELVHPDKGVELLLYELAVGEGHRRRGVATALIIALRALARNRGCYGMFVLVDDDNGPALATYAAAGARHESSPRMLGWTPP